MATLITQAVHMYDKVMENADPRVAGWFLMDSPLPSFVICLAYFIFVALGPSIMKDRKPIEMRRVLVVYNIAMVGMSTFCFVEFLLSGWLAGYTLGCQPVDYSYSPQALRMARVCWWFYFSKFIELLDTVFFIMRKKFSQVTFLHVFHHGIMPISWWFGVKLVPGGFGTFHSLLNSFIHLMMYTFCVCVCVCVCAGGFGTFHSLLNSFIHLMMYTFCVCVCVCVQGGLAPSTPC
ncbi:very long chain fatty acid elongase 7-like isoform X3 [Babylonia areolata]|uniref:very long chain fatty acid elongase 7-like isoform X3 n=1 Tax=Babylonia areolata TaxID=304850 RepID=UPI003FD4C54F